MKYHKYKKAVILTVTVCALLSTSGCKWRDDFRSRVHPQYELQKPEPTFNKDSEHYAGEKVPKDKSKGQPDLEAIDGLSEIPELPDSPEPMDD